MQRLQINLFESVFLFMYQSGKTMKSCLGGLLILMSVNFCVAQSAQQQLEEGDLLFSQKKYLPALEKYEALLQEGRFSEQMLLKMAYVAEASNQFPKALYFLSLYHKHYPSIQNLKKMRDLADAHEIKGYEITDYDYVATLYHQNQLLLLGLGVLVVLSGIGLLFWLKRRASNLTFPSFVLILFTALFVGIFFFDFPQEQAIVQSEEALLMKGPGAGSDLIEKITGGHRVEPLEKHDIWRKIKWEGREVFIRESNLVYP